MTIFIGSRDLRRQDKTRVFCHRKLFFDSSRSDQQRRCILFGGLGVFAQDAVVSISTVQGPNIQLVLPKAFAQEQHQWQLVQVEHFLDV